MDSLYMGKTEANMANSELQGEEYATWRRNEWRRSTRTGNLPRHLQPLQQGVQSKAWFMDSGCTQHMTNRATWLQNFRTSTVPHLSLNLISQTQLDGSGCKTFSNNGKLWVFVPKWKVLAEGERKQGLYEMRVMEKPIPEAKVTYLDEPEEGKKAREELLSKMEEAYGHEWQQQTLMVAAKPKSVDLNTMHRRMAHASSSRIKELFKKKMVTGVELVEGNGVEVTTCTSCVGRTRRSLTQCMVLSWSHMRRWRLSRRMCVDP
ncbi:hypothetical protein CLOP_g12401 [Closterium sp. NIES-67]|nr:hypothetical protein CLOP_g17754 [Closterium sp. NIES-67]GJP82192.1 hypothetical protein CLOP_g12401 [Closterium sp. NIES-67]